MFEYNRKKQIIAYLDNNSGAKITELAKELYCSEATIRRDLIALEQEGLVKRVHGGAVLSQHQKAIFPYDVRESANIQAKETIAYKAAELVHNGDTVMLDGFSSTTRRMCKYIKTRKNVKLITNNYQIYDFFKGTSVTVFCTGGNYSMQSDCFEGFYTESFIHRFNADLHFFSATGISEDGFVAGKSIPVAGINTAMIHQSERNYLLLDSSKINVKAPLVICHANDLTGIICDEPIPEFKKNTKSFFTV
ncbi:MAG: DeoR/GlpR transcriptional regulator [Lachnospiraceae bacterium]|nr:DeoR/GlpR transcriptional regulator [Lachnospiraceae bacterium]